MNHVDASRLEGAYQTALAALLAERMPEGHWVGELSTSALSTATAVSALALVRKASTAHGSFDALISGGIDWLVAHQNADGGWGDTVRSFSNISTTMLCRAAFHLSGAVVGHEETLRRTERWLQESYGKTPEELAEAVRARYGKDRTFSVPILMTSALAGLVSWNEVPSLPFELACFPQSLFRFLRIPVVSYALPALIAIGQAVYRYRPPWNPLTRLLRRLAIGKSLRVLQQIQPSSGGFLEATPLTSFVTMALASIGRGDHPVVSKSVEFLASSVRPDGSWPIDTNLATWVTTLSVNALAAAGDLENLDRKGQLCDWLLRQQYKERHPYTGADPGGWAWTDLPGGVPDADDTPGALLALSHLDNREGPAWERLAANPDLAFAEDCGIKWLIELRNADGGWPTFCRGWQQLPFDRSGDDLTAHALRALVRWWRRRYDGRVEKAQAMLLNILTRERPWFQLNYWWLDMRLSVSYFDLNAWRDALHKGMAYLNHKQRPDGSWLPLWFGNQHAPDDENPTYGTARVLAAYRDLDFLDSEPARRGIAWLLSAQNADGGWGGVANTPSSIEETALAVEVLIDGGPASESAVERGLAWLIERIEAGGLQRATPIGFYFAKLWYFEKLYPIIFSVAALGRARRKLRQSLGHE
ncbi:MAG TPA: prenyltransferase/squalene oxidase repeat-containing protein [Gemmataceae bacterium]|jgi:squalene-hopene/tetraprenyl-beta-curcumene cyclase